MDILWVSNNSEKITHAFHELATSNLIMHHSQDGQDALFIAATQSPKLIVIDSQLNSLEQQNLTSYIEQNFALSVLPLHSNGNNLCANWENICNLVIEHFNEVKKHPQLSQQVIEKLDLTQCEHKVLSYLYKLEGQVIDKAELQGKALNKQYTKLDRNLDMHICNIRKKLSEFGLPRSLIRTVRGNGYILSR